MESSSPLLSNYSKLPASTFVDEGKGYLTFAYDEPIASSIPGKTSLTDDCLNDADEYLTYLSSHNNNNNSYSTFNGTTATMNNKADQNYQLQTSSGTTTNNNTFCPNNYSSTDSANSSSTHGPSFSPHSSSAYSPAGPTSSITTNGGGGIKRKFDELQAYPTTTGQQQNCDDQQSFYQISNQSKLYHRSSGPLAFQQGQSVNQNISKAKQLVNNLDDKHRLDVKSEDQNDEQIIPDQLQNLNGQGNQLESTNTGTTTTTARRKNATRESTAILKAWLQEHMKNPYPTKGEKIMLAIITKMTLTQVSTWFANARRRLKKENKMTWIPKNRSEESDDEHSDSEDFLTSSDVKEININNKRDDIADINDQCSTSDPDLNNDANNNNGSFTNIDHSKDPNAWSSQQQTSETNYHSMQPSSYRSLIDYQTQHDTMGRQAFYDSFPNSNNNSTQHHQYFGHFPQFNNQHFNNENANNNNTNGYYAYGNSNSHPTNVNNMLPTSGSFELTDYAHHHQESSEYHHLHSAIGQRQTVHGSSYYDPRTTT